MRKLGLICAGLVWSGSLAAQTVTPRQFVGNLQVTISDALTEIKAELIERDRQIDVLTKRTAALDGEIARLKTQSIIAAPPPPSVNPDPSDVPPQLRKEKP